MIARFRQCGQIIHAGCFNCQRFVGTVSKVRLSNGEDSSFVGKYFQNLNCEGQIRLKYRLVGSLRAHDQSCILTKDDFLTNKGVIKVLITLSPLTSSYTMIANRSESRRNKPVSFFQFKSPAKSHCVVNICRYSGQAKRQKTKRFLDVLSSIVLLVVILREIIHFICPQKLSILYKQACC